jgi:cytochrome c553
MKNLTLISLVTVAFLFVGCGEEKKESTSAPVEQAVTETVEESTTSTEVVATTEEVVEEVSAETDAVPQIETNATEVVEEASSETNATEATEPAEEVAAEAPGKALFATCAACHGPDGKTLALGKGAAIAGQERADLLEKMHAYKAGTRDVTGNGMLMKGQMAALSDADMEALADYIASL